MSEPGQLEASETAQPDGQPSQESIPVSSYNVVPLTERGSQQELFGYRASMNELPQEEEAPKLPKNKALVIVAPVMIVLLLAVLGVLAFPGLFKSKPPALYVDLGTRRFDPAGLGGRLIARWDGSAAYQLYIDPLDPQLTAQFQAVALNPAHPLTLVIRLLDSAGQVQCQKEVVFPAPPQLDDPSDITPALVAMQAANGDTVQNVAGADGQVAEITMAGSLPCSLKAYQSLTGWDFFTNFPTVDEQAAWLRHQNEIVAVRRGRAGGVSRASSLRAEKLASPIDGDDVIVGDNPSHGTIETGGGHEFFVSNRSAEWQVFPAAIHFRCDKNGSCVLTRQSSHTTLVAKLIK